MPGHILRRQGDSAGVLAAAANLAGIDGAVVGDVLDDPLLSVCDSERGVISAGLDQVTGPDGQAVAAGCRHLVINLATLNPAGAHALIQLRRLVVRNDRDRLAMVSGLGDTLAGLLIIGVQRHEPQHGKLVEHVARGLAIAQRQRECCVLGIGEPV